MGSLIDTLRDEHRNIGRLLDALEHEVDVFAAEGAPDYDVVEGVADYFLDYPERCHHPKEDAVFERLAMVAPMEAALIGDLPAEHMALRERAWLFRQTIRALLGDTDIARDAIVAAARAFITSERRHMEVEEERFLPLAARLLGPADWAAIESGLTHRPDPLFGGETEARFRKLGERLLAWERESAA